MRAGRLQHELFALDDTGTGNQKRPMPRTDFERTDLDFVRHESFYLDFREMLKPVFQQGRRRVKTGGVPSGVR